MQRFVSFLTIFFTLILPSLASANSSAIFTVEDIKVDQRGKNATIARQKALDSAQKDAYSILLKRLTNEHSSSNIPELDLDDIAGIVQSYKINNEKISAGRYRATIDVTFFPERTKSMLKDYGIAVIEQQKPPTLLIPIFTRDEKTILWSRRNLWKDALSQATDKRSAITLSDFVMPLGDIEDIAMSNIQSIRDGNPDYFEPLMAKYNTSQVIVLDANYIETNSENGEAILQVLISTPTDPESISRTANFSSEGTNTDAKRFIETAASDIVKRIENEWKGQRTLNSDLLELTIVIPYNSIYKWVELKKQLASLKFLYQVSIESVSPRRAYINLSYKGQLDTLLSQLNKHHLYLIEDNDTLTLKTSL
ncbi:MAG: DUF2066 domain-containing protein [Rickettsiales bacterium]|nr:DUF2066 domain-containing protein [Rickettsiales bacterium]